MILLTEREINKVTLQYVRGDTYYHGAANAALIRAQLKKVVEYIDKEIIGDCLAKEPYVHACLDKGKWQALKKEVGG